MRHVNIPVFIPHLGCPNQCVFCNQRFISGVREFDPEELSSIIESSLSTVSSDDFVEIAFFGGSFTGIDKSLMIKLLEIAYSYVERGQVKSIRCSTRPDYINEEIIGILKKYRVNVVELGLQSVSEDVLLKTKRNHTFSQEKEACRLITEAGISLVGQMMIGLPSSTLEDEIKTAEFIINSGACAARVYPTVVFKETELFYMAKEGVYQPLSLEDAVFRSAKIVEILRNAGVQVIRVGLCSSDNLSSESSYFAGPNHPALGELVENRIYFDRISEKAKELTLDENTVICVNVPPASLSKAIGQKKCNKSLLINSLGIKDAVFMESSSLKDYEILVTVRKDK